MCLSCMHACQNRVSKFLLLFMYLFIFMFVCFWSVRKGTLAHWSTMTPESTRTHTQTLIELQYIYIYIIKMHGKVDIVVYIYFFIERNFCAVAVDRS